MRQAITSKAQEIATQTVDANRFRPGIAGNAGNRHAGNRHADCRRRESPRRESPRGNRPTGALRRRLPRFLGILVVRHGSLGPSGAPTHIPVTKTRIPRPGAGRACSEASLADLQSLPITAEIMQHHHGLPVPLHPGEAQAVLPCNQFPGSLLPPRTRRELFPVRATGGHDAKPGTAEAPSAAANKLIDQAALQLLCAHSGFQHRAQQMQANTVVASLQGAAYSKDVALLLRVRLHPIVVKPQRMHAVEQARVFEGGMPVAPRLHEGLLPKLQDGACRGKPEHTAQE